MELNPELYALPQTEINAHGEVNLVYGSLTIRGVTSMSNTLAKFIDPDTIEGIDLGCGDGELIFHLQTMLEGSTWHGVEISESRVNKQKRPVFIWCGDFLQESLRAYNILHVDNVCFEESLVEQLEQKIYQEFCGIYITYRPLVYGPLLKKAVHICSVPTEATWSTHTIRYYRI